MHIPFCLPSLATTPTFSPLSLSLSMCVCLNAFLATFLKSDGVSAMMWMMGGYNEAAAGADFNTIQDPFTARRTAAAATSPPPCFTRTTDLLALNHHLAAAMGEQQVVVSSRWNPTPEQLQTLEELYRSGTRTPSAQQIQQITAQLRKYGKIEGKNVFYWFQNHKARERQKRCRPLPQGGVAAAATNRTTFEAKQMKKLVSPTNSSTTAEKTICTQGASTTEETECKGTKARREWAQLDDDSELLQQRRHVTWQAINVSCSSLVSSPSIINSHHHLITTSSISSTLTATSHATTVIPAIMHANKLPHDDDFISIFPYSHPNEGTQTLQLFPIRCGRNDDQEEDVYEDDDDDDDGELGVDHDVAPYQFFEFLPIKN